MSFINLKLEGVAEPEAVPEGEYELRIIKVEDTESKKGNPMTVVTLRIEDSQTPNPSPVFHYIVYPAEDLPENQKGFRLLDIKRFLTLFEVPFNEQEGFDTEELNGQTARCLLTQEEGDDGIVRNRLRLPKLR